MPITAQQLALLWATLYVLSLWGRM